MKIIKKKSDNMLKLLWQSEEKNPNGDPFLSVKRSRDRYVFAERLGRDSIAFILYDKNSKRYGLIKESKPPLDGEDYLAYLITAFGGSIDMDKSAQEICQIEAEEESGYIVPLESIHYVGETFVSSQMSQMCKLFVVDVTGICKSEIAEWEESDSLDAGEERFYWMSRDEVMDNMDWKSIFIVARMEYLT